MTVDRRMEDLKYSIDSFRRKARQDDRYEGLSGLYQVNA